MIVLRRDRVDTAAAQRLLADLDAELDERYGESDIPPPVLDPTSFVPPRGVFVVADLDGEAVGCGGLRPGPAAGCGEVKRMYVCPHVRGRRIAALVLDELERAARELGYSRMVLETGTAQPEAIRLYERLGWTPVPVFGHYSSSPLSRCYGRELA